MLKYQIPVFLKKMIKGDLLGSGTYGVVYSCSDKNTGGNYAIKRNMASKNTFFLNSIRELDLLVKLRNHPHIVRLEYVSYDNPFIEGCFEILESKDRKQQRDDNIHFIFNKATCDLHEFIGNTMKNKDFKLIKRYMIQLLLSVEYIHHHKIIHCDIKPSNVLIMEDDFDILGNKNIVQLCDFGLSIPHTYQGYQTPNVVTSWYRAPEIILGYPHYDYKSDIWALGCILFEMISGTAFLFGSATGDNSLISRILGKLPEEIPTKLMRSFVKANKWRKIELFKYATPAKNKRKNWLVQLGLSVGEIREFEEKIGKIDIFCDLLDQMIKFDWDERNNITECINHPFFNDQLDLITENRRLYNPIGSFEKELHIYECTERKWICEEVLNIYKNRNKIKWYDHRVLFQSIRLFDSYMAGMFELNNVLPANGEIFTKYETLLKFYSFIYLSIKYFGVLEFKISFNDVFGPEYRTPDAKSEIESFEIGIIQSMGYNFYYISVYEAADTHDIFLREEQIDKLLKCYLNVSDILIIKPADFVKKVLVN